MKSKTQKREEAEIRQTEYNKLSTKEKLERLDEKNLVAKKERKKLEKQLSQNS